ncbi:right-handed parallel beta-helix repeat-containing protein, partial [bacterium]|nr:right-handed parallel beta-helix repeat-containing protein [bacterium]
EPNSDEDGTQTTDKPFNISATEMGGQTLYVWLEDSQGNKNYQTRIGVDLFYDDTNPFPPIDLTANGHNPSEWQYNPNFTIDWTNPITPVENPITSYWYKLGAEPSFDEDGTQIIDKPFTATTTQQYGQMLYLWLEDSQGNKNYQNYSSVGLHYQESVFDPPEYIQGIPGDEFASFSWEPGQVIGHTLAGYNIYQSLTSDGFSEGMTPLNDVLIDENDLTYLADSLNNEITYYFALKTIDTDEVESEFSRPIFVTPYLGSYIQFMDAEEVLSEGRHRGDLDTYGNKIAWIEWENNNSDVYLYDISTDSLLQITQDNYYQNNPAIYENKVVWSEQGEYSTDIYVYDIDTATISPITQDNYYQNYPDIYENKVVWSDSRDGYRNIYLYDLELGVEEQINSSQAYSERPKIYENKIVWIEGYNNNYNIYLYDLNTEVITEVGQCDGYPFDLSFDDGKIAWTENRNIADDLWMSYIYVYDLDTQNVKEVTNNQYIDSLSLHNNMITWAENRNGPETIYLYDIITSNEYQVSPNFTSQSTPIIRNNKILWQKYYYDYDNSVYGYKLYSKEISASGINPEITIFQDQTEILNNIGSFDFGRAVETSEKIFTFTIKNEGQEDLELIGDPIIEIAGNDIDNFEVITQATSLVNPEESIEFQIKFTPDVVGIYEAIISIENNTSDENPYEFTIIGTGIDQPECGDIIAEDITLVGDLFCANTALTIETDDIILDCNGHSITGDAIGYDFGVFLDEVEGVTVKNCVISGFKKGISLEKGNNHQILNNELFDNYGGIWLVESQNNMLNENNSHENEEYGIYLGGASDNNTITHNTTIDNGPSGSSAGIRLDWSSNNSVIANIATNNGAYGIALNQANGNTVENNLINNNDEQGVFMFVAEDSQITGNTIFGNGVEGIWLRGYSDGDTKNNLIKDNLFFGNTDYAIRANEYTNDNQIYNNSFIYNGDQAQDYGLNNTWFYNESGNYWSDHVCIDKIAPFGICENPYTFNNNSDLYPLLLGSMFSN